MVVQNNGDYGHKTVLLKEAVELLAIKPDGIYVDATLGGGGHTQEILNHLTSGKLFSFDQDEKAIEYNQKRFKSEIKQNQLNLIHSNFSNLKSELGKKNIKEIDGILFDLGVSSPQFDDEDRGFSYRFDSKLDMRMDQTQELSALEVINDYPQNELANLIFQYGDEKFSRSIAKNIVENRPITTTFQLVEIIKKSLPAKVVNSKGHPAKKTFQAIRIEVNNELNVFKSALTQAASMLNPNGVISVITFQSLEDKIAKKLFVDLSTPVKIPSGIPITDDFNQVDFINLTKKPITASEEELEINHRSQSAKLRGVKKI